MIFDINKRSDKSYKIVRRLGSGAFGTSYLVRSDDTERDFVLKEIPIRDPTRIADLFREVNILRKISQHGCKPYLLCYHDYFINPDTQTLNIVTEAFPNARTLREFIVAYQRDRTFIKRDDLLKIMVNLLGALVYLHKLGIVHGDLKPENILINEDLQTQIIDFGLACSKHCKPSGTILFASPEVLKMIPSQARGRETEVSPYYLQASDVFSMGLVFYLLANLEFPFSIRGNNPYGYDNSILKQYNTLDTQDTQKSIDLDNLSNASSEDEEPSVAGTIAEQSDYQRYLYDVNTENETVAIYTLAKFYKARGHSIMSFYNYNQTDLDKEINELIESMLRLAVHTTHQKNSRPSAKHLYSRLKRIVMKNTMTKAILGIPRGEDSQILFSPSLSTANSDGAQLSPRKF